MSEATMTREQLAGFLDTTVLEVGRLTKEKILESTAGGKTYEIRKCVGQYIRWLRDDADSRSLNEEIQKARLEKLKIEKTRIEGQLSGDAWKGKATVVELGKGFSLDRGDVTRALASAGVSFAVVGKAHLYPTIDAIAELLKKKQGSRPASGMEATLTEARTRESLAKAEKTELEIETIQKTRIPVDVVNDAIEPAFGLIKKLIMGSKLADPDKREICDALRDIPTKLRW